MMNKWVKEFGHHGFSGVRDNASIRDLEQFSREQMIKILKSLFEEKTDYSGMINFVSKGIDGNDDSIKAFDYGKQVGIECGKQDLLLKIKELEGKDNMYTEDEQRIFDEGLGMGVNLAREQLNKSRLIEIIEDLRK